jgi:hypothetical protein
MAFRFQCPGCGVTMIAMEESAGGQTRCAKCQTTFPIPDPDGRASSRSSERDPSPEYEEDDRPRREREPEPEPEYSDDREPDRPRGRRRRPPPRSGYSALTVFGIFFGGVALLSGFCCCGGFLSLPEEKWNTHQSAQGGFSAEFPITPERDFDGSEFDDPDAKVEGGFLWKRFEEYGVKYWDLERNGRTDEQIIDNYTRQFLSDHELRAMNKKPVVVSGFPGVEMTGQGGDGYYTCLCVVTERRFYLASAGGPFVKPDSANVRRFIDSFKVTGEPPPKKPREKR